MGASMTKQDYPTCPVFHTMEEVYSLQGDEDQEFIELTFFEYYLRKSIYERLIGVIPKDIK